MGKKIDRKSNSDLVLQDYSEDEFDKEEEITRPRKGNDSNHAKSSVQDVLKDPNFSIKHASLPIKAKNEDMTFTLGSSDLLGETAPRRNRREKQWEISKDEFSGFDLSNMLGLDNSHGDKEKKADAHASKPNGSENGRSAITKSSQIQEPLKSDAMYQDDDIPSYVKTFSNQENGRRGRRGGGNTQTEITNDKAAPKADLANSIKRDTDISLLDLLDKVISSKPANTQSEQNNSSKPHILNIIDTTHSPSKRGMEATDSLSSVALISDTDEEEVPIRPGKDIDGKSKQPKSKDTTPNLKSKHTASNHADDQLKKLTENLQIVTKNFEADLKLEKAQKESLVSENTLLLNKLESITKDHQLEMQNLKSSHQQEISAMLSTTEATKKLNGLVAQVENTTIMVTNLQSQLDVTNDESLRAREKAVEIKEVHLSRMQEELRNESKSLQEERARVEAYLLELQEGIKTAAIKESEALQTIDLEKTRLRVESEKFEREKSAWKFDFNQQKSTFMMDVENWNLQKEALQQEINKVFYIQ